MLTIKERHPIWDIPTETIPLTSGKKIPQLFHKTVVSQPDPQFSGIRLFQKGREMTKWFWGKTRIGIKDKNGMEEK